MRDQLIYWGTTGLSAMVLALVVAGMILHQQNVALQTEVNQRQQQLVAGQSFSQLMQGVTQNLAAAAVEKNDMALRGLLEAEGMKFNVPPIDPVVTSDKMIDKAPRAKKP
jgi:hypothetical protein